MSSFNYHGRSIFVFKPEDGKPEDGKPEDGEYKEGVPLIFLPNAGGSYQNWRYQIDAFSHTRRVFALDLAGYGRSKGHDLPQSQRTHGEVLLALIRTLRLKQVDIAAHCVGAAAAIYAANRCDAIRRLALFSPACKESLAEGVLWPLIQHQGVPGLMRLSRRLLSASQRLSIGQDRWRRFQLGHSSTADFNYVRAPNLRVFTNLASHIPDYALTPLKQPVALYWGTENAVLPISGMQHAANVLTPTQHLQIYGAGHLVMRERPEQITSSLMRFFSEAP